ncbi:type II toxin-antitoxin system RatA family toxin [Azospirillum sp. TSO22-1]|uniref:type II toxin-antitoxin system RatA family toxin n=1 Tax=Azospirillum sp. TSO22-1 TaxID=716789 RepID=UPI001FFFED15|nr:type II toxin-antitoxin system RatA family toxin [Azospirillum sp. TSO22-1]
MTLETAEPALRRHWRMDFPAFTAEQLFAMVADIEGYPAFMPGCVAARVLERRADGSWLVDNVFGFGPLRSRFRSTARFAAPEWLEIVSQDGPWRRFALRWSFTPEGAGCRVDAEVTVEFRSALLAALARTGLPAAEPRIVRAFEERARRLYAGPPEDTP